VSDFSIGGLIHSKRSLANIQHAVASKRPAWRLSFIQCLMGMFGWSQNMTSGGGAAISASGLTPELTEPQGKQVTKAQLSALALRIDRYRKR
jgi:hypothetical protein